MASSHTFSSDCWKEYSNVPESYAGWTLQGLRTSKLREAEEAERAARLGPVTLRIVFPDGTVVQVCIDYMTICLLSLTA